MKKPEQKQPDLASSLDSERLGRQQPGSTKKVQMQKIRLYRSLLVILTSAALWSAPALLRATELRPLIVTGVALDKLATVHPAPVYPRAALALGIDGIV